MLISRKYLFTFVILCLLFLQSGFTVNAKTFAAVLTLQKTEVITDTLEINKLAAVINDLYLNNPNRAMALANKQFKLSSQINYTWGKANALQMKGVIYEFNQKYDDALRCYMQSIQLYSIINNKINILDVTNSTGIAYAKKGIYTEGLKYLLRALDMARRENDIHGYIGTYNNIGLVYRNQGKYDKALEYYLKSINVQEKNNVKYSISYTYLNIGEIYRQKKQPQIALTYYNLGLKSAVSENDSASIANNYSEAGRAYTDLNVYDKALYNQQKALSIRKDIDDGYGIVSSYISLGDIDLKTDNLHQALEYTNKALTILKSSGELDMLAECYRQLSEIDAAMGNYNGAYYNHKLYKKLNDSVFNAENNRKLTEQQLNFEFDAIQKEKDRKAAEAILRQKYIRNYGIAGTVIFTSLLLLYLRKKYKARQARKQKEFDQGIDMLQHEIEIREEEAKALKIENDNMLLRNELEKEYEKNEREKLQEKLDFNRRELASATLYLFQKNQMLSELKTELDNIKRGGASTENLERIKTAIQQNLYLDADWEKFKLHFEQVHPDFFKELNQKHPGLTAYEVRLYAYLHMNLSTKEIAGLLNITPASVIKAKVRLNKKLNNGKAGNNESNNKM